MKADYDKLKIHIVISRTPLKKKISRRHNKNINRVDKIYDKKNIPDPPQNKLTKKTRKEKQRNK